MTLSRDDMTMGEKLRAISWPFLLLVSMVACVGFLSLYSAASGDITRWAAKQMVIFGVGMCGVIVTALIDIRFWMRFAYPFFGFVILLLVYVDVAGHVGMGAQRWINLGFIRLQPSELMKIATVLALAKFYHGATAEDVKNPLFLGVPLVLISMPIILVMIQPDLGTAMKIIFISGAMFFLAGVSYWVFIAAGLAAAAFMPIAWTLMHDYQKRRVLVFLNPENDPLGSGYHITQSKIAIGSGGLLGKGYLEGSQSKLDFLPEKETDFIFTLFTEEWGFVGGVGLIGLFILIIIYGYFMAFHCQNQFGRLLIAGIVINFSLYAIINMGMVMGLMPVVGIPLPMISNGGTAMLTLLFGFGLLMSAHVHRDIKFTRRGLDMA